VVATDIGIAPLFNPDDIVNTNAYDDGNHEDDDVPEPPPDDSPTGGNNEGK
jgi:hypothetical protein